MASAIQQPLQKLPPATASCGDSSHQGYASWLYVLWANFTLQTGGHPNKIASTKPSYVLVCVPVSGLSGVDSCQHSFPANARHHTSHIRVRSWQLRRVSTATLCSYSGLCPQSLGCSALSHINIIYIYISVSARNHATHLELVRLRRRRRVSTATLCGVRSRV